MATKSVLTVAQSQIGVKATNYCRCKYNNWFYGHTVSGSCYAWCAVFIAWCFRQAGCYANISGVSYKAGVASWRDWAKKKGRWSTTAKKGALVIYSWNRNGSADHIGIVEKVNSNGTITAIEGNTGGGNGAVMRRTRSKAYVLGYINVTIYPPSTATKTVSSTKPATSKVYAKGTVTASLLNVRAGASAKNKIVGTYKKGTTINCYGTHGRGANCWWAVNSARTRWVKASYIKVKK